MTYSVNTIPGGFPLGYVLAPCTTECNEPNGHQLYVKERWHGVCPESDYDLCGGRNEDGSVGEYWQMGCLLPGCESAKGSVLTTTELLRELKEGRVVGIYRDGLAIISMSAS